MARLRSAVVRVLRRVLPERQAYVERFDQTRLTGWAADPGGGSEPAVLSLHVDGRAVLSIVADQPREDVRDAGRGPLRCGFDIALPRGLRDGKPHVVELRRGTSGPVLRGGRLQISGGTAADAAVQKGAPDTPPAKPQAETSSAHSMVEGVAFLDPAAQAIAGWATGCTEIRADFGKGLIVTVIPDREVPGLGSGLRAGFRIPVPAVRRDGGWHSVKVLAQPGDISLDGSPVRLRLLPDQVSVSIEALTADHITLQLRDSAGQPADVAVTVLVDGHPVAPDGAADARPGRLHVPLLGEARHLVVQTVAAAADPDGEDPQIDTVPAHHDGSAGTVIARFTLGAGGAETRSGLHDKVAASLPTTYPPDLPDQAAAAFATFCAAPDSRFDADWYALANGLSPDTDALAHYCDGGARVGLSPSPFFDEAVARMRHPDLAAQVESGNLPCLFAVELALRPGVLGSLTGIDPGLAGALGRAETPDQRLAAGDAWAAATARDGRRHRPATPAPVILPPPTSVTRAASSIWSAWLARLDADAATLAAIAADEQATRAELQDTPLAERPLVSIIMPTWNRAFTIGEAIQSVIDQSYGNWELLICDDQSEDRTSQVVRAFDDPRIRYMSFIKSNGAGARNKGLRFARGQIIAYLDSDNLWHPLFLDLMLRRLLAEPGRMIAYCAYLDTETEGAQVRLDRIARPAFRAVQLSSKNFMDLNTIMHRREVYDWLGGFDGLLPRLQDWDLALRYTRVFEPAFVDRIGVYYRRNVAWSQVTNLFQGSGAQDIVNAKTKARIAGQGERLDIRWPARPRVAVLTTPATAATGRALARMAAGFADVDLFEPGAAQPDLAASLAHHAIAPDLWSDPRRFGAVTGLGDGRTILTTGLSAGWLAALGDVDPERVLMLTGSVSGLVLAGTGHDTGAGSLRLPLGGLALRLPATTDPDDRRVLLLAGNLGSATRDAFRAEGVRHGLDIIVPPRPGRDWPWEQSGTAGAAPLEIAAGADLPDALASVALTVVPGAWSTLPPLEQAVLAALMAAGRPVAIAAEPRHPESLANQWIEARAAYDIRQSRPDWVFDKVPKILADGPGRARLSERAALVSGIAQNPQAAAEKLAHALWQMLHRHPDQPRKDRS